MTRAQKVAKACGYCGASLEGRDPRAKFCSEKHRKRHWEHSLDNRGRCEDCGGVLGIGCGARPSRTIKRCAPCEREARLDVVRERGEQIERLWSAGLSLNEIAAKLQMTLNHLGKDMHYLRGLGFNLPYRHQGDRKGTGVPELRRAA